MNRKVFLLICTFIFSRIIFINPLPVFFDSPEYLERFANPNYFQAIASGHIPFHVGFITLFWPIYHLAKTVNVNPALLVIIVQIIFSAVAIYFFYRFVKIIVSKKTALIATIICSLTPIYWITNATIMVESTYINCFLISLFAIAQYAKKNNGANINLLIGCVSFGLAILTNPLVIFWSPLLLSVTYFLKKRRFIAVILSIFITIVISIIINCLFISHALNLPLQDGIMQYLFGVDIRIAPNLSSTIMILRFLRNLFIPILQNNTAIILVIGIISIIKIFNKNKKLFILVLLWILPSLLANQWYDPLLFGRHSVISGFGIALLAAIFLEKKKILLDITIFYLLLISLPAIYLLKQPIPYLEMSKFLKNLPTGLLIESHFARPQVERSYPGKIIFTNQPGWSKGMLMETIDNYFNDKKPIFITSQALSDPYGIYSGPFLYPLSLSYAKKFELHDIATNYSIKKYAVIDGDTGLIIYQIVSKVKSKYPDIPILNYNRHQINYFDPANQLWLLIERAKIIQNHNIING